MTDVRDVPFLWGTATSSHQIEGFNIHNDWWQWEQNGRLPFKSGAACDGWNQYASDIDIIQQLGHTAYRFSIEWSRVEPCEGAWDFAAIQRYRGMLLLLREKGIEPIVTLHHFTNPQWLAEKEGWLNPETVFYFTRFVRLVVSELGDLVGTWITINEPVVYLVHAYFLGVWPPGKQSFGEAVSVFRNLVMAHVRAYVEINSIYAKRHWSTCRISIAKHFFFHEPCRRNSWLDVLTVHLRNWFLNDLFVRACQTGFLFFPGLLCESLPAQNTLDFLGVNYYSKHYIQSGNYFSPEIFGSICDVKHHQDAILATNSLGWIISSEGLGSILRDCCKYGVPLLITENGICTDDDEKRCEFISGHLKVLADARDQGVPVEGYLYWSLLDNFEWDKGFAPRFGLIEIDFETQRRKIRKSAYVLEELCRKFSHGTYQFTKGSIPDNIRSLR